MQKFYCGCEADFNKHTRTYCSMHDYGNPAAKILNQSIDWETKERGVNIRVIEGYTDLLLHELYKIMGGN